MELRAKSLKLRARGRALAYRPLFCRAGKHTLTVNEYLQTGPLARAGCAGGTLAAVAVSTDRRVAGHRGGARAWAAYQPPCRFTAPQGPPGGRAAGCPCRGRHARLFGAAGRVGCVGGGVGGFGEERLELRAQSLEPEGWRRRVRSSATSMPAVLLHSAAAGHRSRRARPRSCVNESWHSSSRVEPRAISMNRAKSASVAREDP